MAIYHDDVTFWTRHWDSTGEIVPEAIARTVAEYWQASSEQGFLPRFTRGESVDKSLLLEDIDDVIRHAKIAGPFDTVHELYALKAWVLIHY